MRASRTICITTLGPLTLVFALAAPARAEVHPTLSASTSRSSAWSIDIGAGYGGYWGAQMLGPMVAAQGPMVVGSGTATFGRGVVRHGIRIAGFYGRLEGTQFERDPYEAQLFGAAVGYVLSVRGFWFSPGVGVSGLRATHLIGDETSLDPRHHIFPEAVLASGYDIALSRHLALRLAGEAGLTPLGYGITARAQGTGSLVVRF